MTDPRLLAADRLEAAAYVIQLPGCWTQGNAARNVFGDPVGPNTRGACCWCVMGAYIEAGGSPPDEGWEALNHVVGGSPIVENDKPGMTGECMSRYMLRAADALRKEVGGAR